jgi:hypothetical protein
VEVAQTSTERSPPSDTPRLYARMVRGGRPREACGAHPPRRPMVSPCRRACGPAVCPHRGRAPGLRALADARLLGVVSPRARAPPLGSALPDAPGGARPVAGRPPCGAWRTPRGARGSPPGGQDAARRRWARKARGISAGLSAGNSVDYYSPGLPRCSKPILFAARCRPYFTYSDFSPVQSSVNNRSTKS